VVVTNTAGTVTSSAATLTVNAAAVAPTITTQASESDRDCGAGSDVYGSGGRYSAPELPVAEEQREHCRSDFSELHDAGNDDLG